MRIVAKPCEANLRLRRLLRLELTPQPSVQSNRPKRPGSRLGVAPPRQRPRATGNHGADFGLLVPAYPSPKIPDDGNDAQVRFVGVECLRSVSIL